MRQPNKLLTWREGQVLVFEALDNAVKALFDGNVGHMTQQRYRGARRLVEHAHLSLRRRRIKEGPYKQQNWLLSQYTVLMYLPTFNNIDNSNCL